MIEKIDINSYSKEINGLLEKEINLFFSTIPYAKHLAASDEPLNEAYYIRHRIETIKRIRLTAKTDALALSKMIDENYELARRWGKYTIQELNHDKMFLADLKAHHIAEAQVFTTPLFFATQNLITYLEESIHQYGSLPAVYYSLFVEWNADRYSKNVVEKAKIQYSSDHVKGAEAHVNFDDVHDHYQIILEIAHKLSHGDKTTFFILCDISKLFRDYFNELYCQTVLPSLPIQEAI